MEQSDSIKNKIIETKNKVSSNSIIVSSYGKPLKAIIKKIVIFICYGPGVLGFLWLIGRIFKR